jgi:hypothetical protein
MKKKFEVGDSVTWEKYVGKIVGFNARGWPIVEWPDKQTVLVQNPDDIILVFKEDPFSFVPGMCPTCKRWRSDLSIRCATCGEID